MKTPSGSQGLSSSLPPGAREGREDDRPWERGCEKHTRWLRCSLVYHACSLQFNTNCSKEANLSPGGIMGNALSRTIVGNFERNTWRHICLGVPPYGQGIAFSNEDVGAIIASLIYFPTESDFHRNKQRQFQFSVHPCTAIDLCSRLLLEDTSGWQRWNEISIVTAEQIFLCFSSLIAVLLWPQTNQLKLFERILYYLSSYEIRFSKGFITLHLSPSPKPLQKYSMRWSMLFLKLLPFNERTA